MRKVVFALVLIFMLALGYIYFFQLTPIFVEDPKLIENMPDISPGSETEKIVFEIISFLNFFDLYKVHNVPFTDDFPLVEINLIDINENYFFLVTNNQIIYTKNTEKEPDIKIITKRDIIKNIDSLDLKSLILKGDIQINVIRDEKVLALKGYKVLYDKFNNKITGQIINTPIRMAKTAQLLFIILLSIILGIIIKKEL